MERRNTLVDSMRGFSLLGIMLANMLIFQYGMWGKDDLEHFPTFTGDTVAHVWLKVFVESSFMPIFMFLFGFGMVRMMEKLDSTGGKVKRVFFRRFLLMLVIGLLHARYFFEGDILTTYGFLGMFLLLFLRRKPKTLWIWAVTLIVLTSLGNYGPDILHETETAKNIDHYVEKAIPIYTSGSFTEISEFRMSPEDPLGLTDVQYMIVFALAPFATFPMFLLGMIAAKKGWFSAPAERRLAYLRGVVVLVPAGLVMKSIPLIFSNWSWSFVLGSLGATLLAIGYICLFSYLYTRGNVALFALFEKVGRLSMTNYLMQSVICSLVFYGYGLGLYGKIGVFNGILLSLVVFGSQVVASHWYLKKWKMGPFERILRTVTYLSWNGKRKNRVTVKRDGQVSAIS